MRISNHYFALASAAWMVLAAAGCSKTEQPKPAPVKQEAPAASREKTAPASKTEEAKTAESNMLKLTDAEMEAAGIKVEDADEQDVHDHISVTATIQPNRDKLAHVAPRVSGRLIKVNASLGQQVKQGQALAQLEFHQIEVEVDDLHHVPAA